METDSAVNEKADPLVVRGLCLGGDSVGRSGREDFSEAGGISLRVGSGEIVAVLGENGSGKSLLLALLTGLVAPKRGSVRIFGYDMAVRNEREQARREIGVVFQQAALLGGLTVAENVALPLKVKRGLRRHASESEQFEESERDERAEVESLLELVGARECLEARRDSTRRTWVESLLELVGMRERGGLYPREISDGVRRCVALARALAGGRRLLLCDGGTAGLSPDRAYQIDELIGSVVKRKIVEAALIFTQSVDTVARIADRYVLLGSEKDFGKVMSQGKRKDFADNSAVRDFLRQPPSSPWSGSKKKEKQAFEFNETRWSYE
jgi:ABC-type transporter Mla maintaining outer membrane lipid asymmetry ATPase subunit MlaF